MFVLKEYKICCILSENKPPPSKQGCRGLLYLIPDSPKSSHPNFSENIISTILLF